MASLISLCVEYGLNMIERIDRMQCVEQMAGF